MNSQLKIYGSFLIFLSVVMIFFNSCSGKVSTDNIPNDTNVTAVATWSSSSPFMVQVGTSTNITLTFNSNDPKKTINDLTLGSFTLPSGWSWVSPASAPILGNRSKPLCKTVEINTCFVMFKFSPTVNSNPDPGSIVIPFTYSTNNKSTLKSDVTSIQYKITTSNVLNATVNPMSTPIVATIGQTLPVDVIFSPSDLNQVTSVVITKTLPSGWSDITVGPMCSTIQPNLSSSSCNTTMHLRYQPGSIATSGSFIINYTYKSSDGASKSGSKTISYSSTSNNTLNVTLTSNTTGVFPIVASLYNTYQVTAHFSTSDGNTVSNFNPTFNGFTSTPGWSMVGNTCSSGTMLSCDMIFYYTPQFTTSGVNSVTLAYSYASNAGITQGSAFTVLFSTPNYVVANTSSLDFQTAGYATVSFTSNDSNYISGFSPYVTPSGPLYIVSDTCGGTVPPAYLGSCDVTIYYDGSSSAGLGSLAWTYTPYNGDPNSGEGSLPITYNSLVITHVTGDLTNTPLYGTNYIIYQVADASGSPLSYSYINSSPSLPTGISSFDPSGFGYSPWCDSFGWYSVPSCYIGLQYSPNVQDSGVFDYIGSYSMYFDWYGWQYPTVNIPGINYSVAVPGSGNVSFPTWQIDSGTPPVTQDLSSYGSTTVYATINAAYGSIPPNTVHQYAFQINPPSGYMMNVYSTSFNVNFSNFTGGSIQNINDGCSSIFSSWSSCTVSFEYAPPPGPGPDPMNPFEAGTINYYFAYQPSDSGFTLYDTVEIDFHAN